MVQGVVNQLVSTFGDNYLHLGGDEVVYGCWLQDPSIQRYMKQHHLATANDLMKEFISRVQALTTQKQRSTVYWEEVFLSGAPLGSSDIIQVWKDEATLLSVARAGVKGLLSYGWCARQHTSSNHSGIWIMAWSQTGLPFTTMNPSTVVPGHLKNSK